MEEKDILVPQLHDLLGSHEGNSLFRKAMGCVHPFPLG